MLSYEEQGQWVTRAGFRERVIQAAVTAGLAVMAEDGATTGHTERAALAQRVFSSPDSMAWMLARGVVTNVNAGIGGNDDPLVSDSTLLWVMGSIWNAYANVGGTEQAPGAAVAPRAARKKESAVAPVEEKEGKEEIPFPSVAVHAAEPEAKKDLLARWRK